MLLFGRIQRDFLTSGRVRVWGGGEGGYVGRYRVRVNLRASGPRSFLYGFQDTRTAYRFGEIFASRPRGSQ